MKLRVQGTRAECQAVAERLTGGALADLAQVSAVSPFRPDRRPGPPPRVVDPGDLAALGPAVDVPELARLAGIETSTLRAYLSRGEADVPAPDAAVGGRRYWRKATALAWLNARTRPPTLGRIYLTLRPVPSPSTREET